MAGVAKEHYKYWGWHQCEGRPAFHTINRAEFYREIGEMDTARGILESVVVEDDFLKRIVSSIREKLETDDCKVFKIQ